MQETNITEKTNNQPRWFTVFRIILGLVLLFKGISFIYDRTILKTMIERTGVETFSQNLNVWSFLVACIHLLGGLFIACGLFTRSSCIVQIPILIIAFFVNIRAADSFELVLSVLVLIGLIFFAVKGSGALSADEYFRSYYKAGNEDGHAGKIFNKNR
ncbi:MAG TPA: DoxX family protein [Puia sp.]|nr:DoxX family protein [Puia sp.]